MTDLAALLHEAADSITVESGAGLAAADLRRGRRAASRRRARRFATRGGGIAAIAAVAVTVWVNQSSGGPQPVQLVAYTGHQAPGFTVDRVPVGWTVQGSTDGATQSALIVGVHGVTIAPVGDDDTDPSHVFGKLVVSDGVKTDDPDSVHVGDEFGSISDGNFSKSGGDVSKSVSFIVVRADPDGAELVLQLPSSLGWTEIQAVAFAKGVHVTG